mmetsp:Transcript_43310/g.112586  ORF Transcript_43310/g.112586 Transcript_43310/m.112586 type:complete len:208 (-) Transcript_43310:174-797(-)
MHCCLGKACPSCGTLGNVGTPCCIGCRTAHTCLGKRTKRTTSTSPSNSCTTSKKARTSFFPPLEPTSPTSTSGPTQKMCERSFHNSETWCFSSEWWTPFGYLPPVHRRRLRWCPGGPSRSSGGRGTCLLCTSSGNNLTTKITGCAPACGASCMGPRMPPGANAISQRGARDGNFGRSWKTPGRCFGTGIDRFSFCPPLRIPSSERSY